MEPSLGSQVVQQLDNNQGDPGTDECFRQPAHEFVVTSQREGKHGSNAGDNDDGLCERTGGEILHNIECVVPRQDWLVSSPGMGGREENCGKAAGRR